VLPLLAPPKLPNKFVILDKRVPPTPALPDCCCWVDNLGLDGAERLLLGGDPGVSLLFSDCCCPLRVYRQTGHEPLILSHGIIQS